jgi:hypothetical protein
MALSATAQRRIVLLLAAVSLACAPVPPPGEVVSTTSESAIIVWDAASKTEHFIRRASFRTKAKDFGFLVPTPTVPELAEADEGAFWILARATAPRIVYKDVESEFPPPTAVAAVKAEAPKSAPVTVVSTAKVAGYDAVVLEASQAAALNDWLKEHGYASSPELVDWLQPYIEKKWRLTAFKISSDGASNAESKSVRMTFKTDAPFYPYREPASQRADSGRRELRVFFLSDERSSGTLGNSGAWSGKTMWSDRIADGDHARLFKELKLAPQDKGAGWLTEFIDESSPRPGTDEIFFRADADQSIVHRPDEIVFRHVYKPGAKPAGSGDFPTGIVVALLAAAAVLVLYLRKKSKKG